jgi:hypothetical protein
MNELGRSIKQATLFCSVFGLLVCGSLQMFGYAEFARGLLVGMIGSAGYLALMWRQLAKNCEAEPAEAVAELQGGWVERALFMGFFCGIAWFIPGVQFAGVLIGLLSLHVAVFIWGLFAMSKIMQKK